MGAWGTGIFQDDTSCDIRDDYKGSLGDGLSGPQATARVLSAHKTSLALASVQWRHGRLESETLQKALSVIDSQSDLKR